MKNPHRETLRRLAKQYHRHHPVDCSRGGILTYHRYDGLDPGRLTWWDDFAFILKDYQVSVAWIHPRMAFLDRLEEEAQQQVSHLSVDFAFEHGTPQYRKLGKSRKKIVCWQADTDNNTNGVVAWATAFEQAVAWLAGESRLRIPPALKACGTRDALAVHLCVPVEVRDEADVRRLAELTKQLLKRETTLSREFPDYGYGRRQWVDDGLAGDPVNLLHVHRIA